MTAPISNEMKERRNKRITLSVQVAANEVVATMERLRLIESCINDLNKIKESIQSEIKNTMGNWVIT